jgi:hypothetical protein
MESLVMRKAVGKSGLFKKSCRNNLSAFNGEPVLTVHRTTDGQLDANENRRADRSSPYGSHFFNGEPHMRDRLQLSFWGLRIDAVGIFAITASVLVVLVFASLLALRF